MTWADQTFGLDTKEIGIIAGVSVCAMALGLFFLVRRRKKANEQADKEAADLSHTLRAQRLASESHQAQRWVTAMRWCICIPLLWPVALLIAPLWWRARNTLADIEEEKPHLKVLQPEKSHPSMSHLQSRSLPSLAEPQSLHTGGRGSGHRARASVRNGRGRRGRGRGLHRDKSTGSTRSDNA